MDGGDGLEGLGGDEALYELLEEAGMLAVGSAGPAPLPFLLAGPIVRRLDPRSVWFWFACSEEIRGCTPNITVYNNNGTVERDLTNAMALDTPPPQVIRLGNRLWVAIVEARPRNTTFTPDWTYGYDLAITGESSTTSVRFSKPELAYKPFDRPTFKLGSTGAKRLVQGSCRRPGGYGEDAFPAFDSWLSQAIAAGGRGGHRPPALILTGDQIYADDVAYPLYEAVVRLARDLFGYVEQLPTTDGKGTFGVDQIPVRDWRGTTARAASMRAVLTRRMPWKPDQTGPIGFTTEDGEGHLLSFAEYAAMYLLVWNDELWSRYVTASPQSSDNGTKNLQGFGRAVAASRRVLANIATYMLLDDHEITDDFNLDATWEAATKNPTARRIISNGLAAYWAFQAWGNDPSQFGPQFGAVVARHLTELSGSRGRPGGAAPAYDDLLHAKHWSYVAPTDPPALCVDTRTRRELSPKGKPILSGPRTWREIAPLIKKHGLAAKQRLLIVLPPPFLPHRSMLKAQEKVYDWPADRYEGDYESYGNEAEQRPDLIQFLRQVLDPPALVVFSGDVHHGSVVDGLYVGGARLDDIYRGRGKWAMRVVQVTSSAIKNVKQEAFEKKRWWTLFQTDAGNIGQVVVPQYENQYKTMPDGTAVAVAARVGKLDGDLGRRTYVFENHLCVVDFLPTEIRASFVGVKDGKVATATTRVSTANDPKTFRPPLPETRQQQPPWMTTR